MPQNTKIHYVDLDMKATMSIQLCHGYTMHHGGDHHGYCASYRVIYNYIVMPQWVYRYRSWVEVWPDILLCRPGQH